MKIAVAGDSAGEGLAQILATHLGASHDVTDLSRVNGDPDEFYANLADRVATAVMAGEYDRAILVCGTGIGVQIAANKVPGVRAAQCHDTYSAGKAATSNNAQIITLGARVVGAELAIASPIGLVADLLCDRLEPLGLRAADDRCEQTLVVEVDGDREIGMITSGGFAPTLEKSIALARVAHDCGVSCQVEIRGKRVAARLVKPPFVRNGKVCVEL